MPPRWGSDFSVASCCCAGLAVVESWFWDRVAPDGGLVNRLSQNFITTAHHKSKHMATAKAPATVTIASTAIRKDAHGRYNLNDLHKAAIENGYATDNHAPAQFLRNDGIKAFIDALEENSENPASDQTVQNCTFSKAENPASVHSSKGRNGGTYAVELVAIRYAAWINPKFEVQVYRIFQAAVKQGKDWASARHDTRQSNIVENAIIQATRADLGKDTTAVHYMSEAKLVAFAAFGEFAGRDRDTMTNQELRLVAYLETRNGVMYARGLPYEERKTRLVKMASEWRARHSTKIAI